MENENKYERVDLGIDGLHLGDFVIGAVLWAGRLITRQYGHEPSIGQQTAPTQVTERMATVPQNFDGNGSEVA